MNESIMACRHLGQFFELCVEYNLDELDFTLKALCSEYKIGIEIYQPQWYSQSQYYYFEEFLEENVVQKRVYDEDEIAYEKERMYWMGYCLQTWSNVEGIVGKEIVHKFGSDGIKHLLDNYRIYHTVDPMYVFEDSSDYIQNI